jgi:hypothetical protein
MLQITVVEKITTYFRSNNVSFSESRAVYEIMWKNIIHPDRPQIKYSIAHARMPDY